MANMNASNVAAAVFNIKHILIVVLVRICLLYVAVVC